MARENGIAGKTVHPYAGRWIARIGNQILAHGFFPEQVKSAARQIRHKEIATLAYIPADELMSFPSSFYTLQCLFQDVEGIYLVGGAVRDALLNKPIHDLDFICTDDTRAIARKAANHLGGSFFCMDEERETYRVILSKGSDCKFLDFMTMRGGSLLADLNLRDFSMNAMAIDLQDPQKLIDPLKGAQALRDKKLIACREDTFVTDPVRILRGIRFAAEGGYSIDPQTRTWMKQAVSGLDGTSIERKREEFFRMLGQRKAATSLRALDWLGSLPSLIPELVSIRENTLPVQWENLLSGIEQWWALKDLISGEYPADGAPDILLGLPVLKLGNYRNELHDHFLHDMDSERTHAGLTVFARMVSFVAFRAGRNETTTGIARRFHLSRAEIHWIEKFHLGYRSVSTLLSQDTPISPVQIYRYFKLTGESGIDAILFCLADELVLLRSTGQIDAWEKMLTQSRLFMETYWRHPEVVYPPAIVTGDDLVQIFHLPPGPALGDLIEQMREEQAAGTITDRHQALEWIRSRIEK